MQEWYTCTGGKRVEKGRICRYCGARPAGEECRGPLPSSQWAPSGPELEPNPSGLSEQEIWQGLEGCLPPVN